MPDPADEIGISKHCTVNIVPQRIDQILNGLMAAFKKIDTDISRCYTRVHPDLAETWLTLVKCWNACGDQYNKQASMDDADAAVKEVVDYATHELSEKIDNIVHEAAKYKIPQIVTDMERARMYEDSCSQLLMCDALESLRKLNIEGLVDEAAQLKLQNVQTYSNMEVSRVEAGGKLFEVGSRLYDCENTKIEEDHHLNPALILETAILGALYAAGATVLEDIFNSARDKEAEAAAVAMAACSDT